jgi:hypothetical protein
LQPVERQQIEALAEVLGGFVFLEAQLRHGVQLAAMRLQVLACGSVDPEHAIA